MVEKRGRRRELACLSNFLVSDIFRAIKFIGTKDGYKNQASIY